MSETKTFLDRDTVLTTLFTMWGLEKDINARRCYADSYCMIRSLCFDNLKSIVDNYGGK